MKQVTIIFTSGEKQGVKYDDSMTSGLTGNFTNYVQNGSPKFSRTSTGVDGNEVYLNLANVAAILIEKPGK